MSTVESLIMWMINNTTFSMCIILTKYTKYQAWHSQLTEQWIYEPHRFLWAALRLPFSSSFQFSEQKIIINTFIRATVITSTIFFPSCVLIHTFLKRVRDKETSVEEADWCSVGRLSVTKFYNAQYKTISDRFISMSMYFCGRQSHYHAVVIHT